MMIIQTEILPGQKASSPLLFNKNFLFTSTADKEYSQVFYYIDLHMICT